MICRLHALLFLSFAFQIPLGYKLVLLSASHNPLRFSACFYRFPFHLILAALFSLEMPSIYVGGDKFLFVNNTGVV